MNSNQKIGLNEEIKDPRFRALLEQLILLRKDFSALKRTLTEIKVEQGKTHQIMAKYYAELGRKY